VKPKLELEGKLASDKGYSDERATVGREGDEEGEEREICDDEYEDGVNSGSGTGGLEGDDGGGGIEGDDGDGGGGIEGDNGGAHNDADKANE
jgi:hypothetical protein